MPKAKSKNKIKKLKQIKYSESINTPPGRICWPFLKEPKQSKKEGYDPKFSCELIFDGENKKISKAVKEFEQKALEFAKTAWGPGIEIDDINLWFMKDGNDCSGTRKDEDGLEEEFIYNGFEDNLYMSANMTYKEDKPNFRPTAINVKRPKPETIDIQEIYGGCYARIRGQFCASEPGGGRSVSFKLKTVQKLADGEKLGGVFEDPVDEMDDWEEEAFDFEAPELESTEDEDEIEAVPMDEEDDNEEEEVVEPVVTKKKRSKKTKDRF